MIQSGHLAVVVPPDILNEPDLNTGSLDEGITNEGGQIQLVCIATGKYKSFKDHIRAGE